MHDGACLSSKGLLTLILNYTDQTENEMRNCIVNIVAVVFGSPPQASHLWYFMMDPSVLKNTYLPGFMVKIYLWNNCYLHTYDCH